MEAKTSKALDTVALNLKRKRAAQYAARIRRALQPTLRHCPSFMSTTNKVVKQTRLGEYRNNALYCDVDENGVQHLVLCRVIMGNMEILCPGTGQFQPSSCEYDNGVDDIQCPRYYVVWNMNMNTHIYPEVHLSFGFTSILFSFVAHITSIIQTNSYLWDLQGIAVGMVASTSKVPLSSWMPFPLLLAAIRSKVPPKDMDLIRRHYGQFTIPSKVELKDSNKKEG
ncbi:Inactive poly of ADP-ribose polymerase RCD1 [Spatholobus suberectus]|nr:Inactive poly of ADP-ribose polymerase RCD1 [Spatholobus suberectus]